MTRLESVPRPLIDTSLRDSYVYFPLKSPRSTLPVQHNEDYVLRVLQDVGLVTRPQIDEAKAHLNGANNIVDVLIRDGIITESDVSRTLAAQAHMDWIDVSSMLIPPDVIKQIRAEDARRFKVIPVGFGETGLIVAVSDPLDIATMDSLSFLLQRELELVCSSPEKIREAVELLHVERIGHGIAAIHDPALMDLLADRRIPLEVCPGSNVLTGALANQLSQQEVRIESHPLPKLLRHGIPIALSTDDPTMFHTDLATEYRNAHRMGLSEPELRSLAQMSFDHAFAYKSLNG